MRVLVVQNFDGADLGQLQPALHEAGAEIDLRKAHRGDGLPVQSEGFDAIIVLGGGQNALADEDFPYIPALLALVRDFAAHDKAVLGICLGAQLLARAFGGSNQIGGAREFGWCEVSLTDAAADDAVLGPVGRAFPIFQWHDDTFTVPPGAVHLATSRTAGSQAFRIGRAVYGMQFHFEADSALVRQWNVTFAEHLARIQPDWANRFPEQAALHAGTADAAGQAIARAWVALV